MLFHLFIFLFPQCYMVNLCIHSYSGGKLTIRMIYVHIVNNTCYNILYGWNQGRIEPPKAARGHATYIDGKMLSVTKYSFQIYFRFHTCNNTSAIANR